MILPTGIFNIEPLFNGSYIFHQTTEEPFNASKLFCSKTAESLLNRPTLAGKIAAEIFWCKSKASVILVNICLICI